MIYGMSMIMTYRELAKKVGVRTTYLDKMSKQASFLYKGYTIPKRNGGLRQIYHPTPYLKQVQRCIVAEILNKFPVHEAVYSYRKGMGIKDLAYYHSKNNYLARVDFSNFFESIKISDVERFLKSGVDEKLFNLTGNEISKVSKLLCRERGLTIGAPSSPSLSNAIMYSFDSVVWEELADMNVKYSRYSDDIYISSSQPNVLTWGIEVIRNQLSTMQGIPSISINEGKTVFTSKKRRREVTGLILTSTGRVSIGREKKRLIRSKLHYLTQNKLDEREVQQLKGHIAFVKSIEPAYVDIISKKYPAAFAKLSKIK
jgi:hypothetical protein